jgi:hypothetical protein
MSTTIPDTDNDEASESWNMGPASEAPNLCQIAHEAIVEAIVEWFFHNFEDPADNTPCDEGEYVWIWGGPYDAREEIEETFGDIASEPAISEAVSEIERKHKGWLWAPSSSRMVRET